LSAAVHLATLINNLDVKMSQPNPQPFANPSRADYFDFLIRCYFGDGGEPLQLCVRRAYLDLNRTMHGFAGHVAAESLRDEAHRKVAQKVITLKQAKVSQKSFDAWHRLSCTEIREHYREGGFGLFTYGQAQKWVNMSLKYVFALGEARLAGYLPYYGFAHIPIDNVFVAAAKAVGGPALPMPWSRLDDYAAYFDLQQCYRAMFAPSAPLAAEFRLWLNGGSGSLSQTGSAGP
jgi:hypothetical protein